MFRMFGQAELLAWGRHNLRDLPWRWTRDPWAITVAEFMLQQTQVERVVPKYGAFLLAYPSPTECAAAPLGDVLVLWQGLGYPRRAKALHDTARVCVNLWDGTFPTRRADLMDLPGVGQYTARAIETVIHGNRSHFINYASSRKDGRSGAGWQTCGRRDRSE